jgi:hypothetical protein
MKVYVGLFLPIPQAKIHTLFWICMFPSFMLNLLVAMFTLKPLLSLLLFVYLVFPASILPAQVAKDKPSVSSPQGGVALQGMVLINGTTDIPGFRSVEVSFGYQDDPTATWFMIDQSATAVKEGLIASWDTSTITDGEYQLRIKVILADGHVSQTVVTNLRVRNYTPVETSTPAAAAGPVEEAKSTQTSLPDFQVTSLTPTPLPTNPAEVTGQNLQSSALRGVAYVVGALLVAGIYWGLRLVLRRF